jgi:hypothetical protein
MDDPLVMSGFERLGRLFRDGQRFIERDGAFVDTLREIVALDKFHHERGQTAVLFESVDGGDVRMIQRGEDLGFALKTGHAVRVMREFGREDLQRDITIELGVPRAVDLPHAAGAKRGEDLVRAEARSERKRQCCRGLYGPGGSDSAAR